MNKQREDGYYWVKALDSEWELMEYTNNSSGYWVDSDRYESQDSGFVKIHETRILNPDDCDEINVYKNMLGDLNSDFESDFSSAMSALVKRNPRAFGYGMTVAAGKPTGLDVPEIITEGKRDIIVDNINKSSRY